MPGAKQEGQQGYEHIDASQQPQVDMSQHLTVQDGRVTQKPLTREQGQAKFAQIVKALEAELKQ